jgi:predicted Zn-ribbon and HTH transcriptional regulator
MAGAALGDSIDENLQLAQYRCQQCGYCFPTDE